MGTLSLAYSLTFIGYEEDKTFPCSYDDVYGLTNGMAQAKNTPDTQRDYYLYSYIEVRWANKANGEQCFVILMSPGENGQQRPSIMKNNEGKAVVVRNMMEGLAYLEVKGWEILEPRSEAGTGKWIVRKKISFTDLVRLLKQIQHTRL